MTFHPGSSTTHPVTVDFIMSSYRIVGQVMVSHTGVMGILTDTTSSIIEVHHAQLAQVDLPTQLADHFDVASLIKKELIVACLNRREDLGPFAYATRDVSNHYPLHVITRDYEINGVLEWTGRFDMATIMSKNISEFIILEDVDISAIAFPNLHVRSEFALINRGQINILALGTIQSLSEDL